MNDRIRQFMAYQGLSASELADSIGVQRSNLTHVLNGRNKPSFQFIAKLMEQYPAINPKWLILGSGEMIQGGKEAANSGLFDELKTEPEVITPPEKSAAEPVREEVQPVYERLIPPDADPQKQVERIVVFYTDQTFKSYSPSK